MTGETLHNFTVEQIGARRREVPFTVQSLGQRRRTLEVGNTLEWQRKGDESKKFYPWAIVRDVITAVPAPDSTQYVHVLREGVEELSGRRFVWRSYFTNNRHGRLHFGQSGPQAPIGIDKWISEQIVERGWYSRISD
jgi:hypothetical protein